MKSLSCLLFLRRFSIELSICRRFLTGCSLLLACVCAAIYPASAVQLIWDPLGNSGVTPASSNWNTTAGNTVWYNGTSDVVWSQTSGTSPLNGAVFNGPDAPPDTYLVTLDSAQMAVTNLTINSSGYTFNGANAVYINTSQFLYVAPGKTVTFNCPMAGSSTDPSWALGSGATMNVTGNLLGSQQLRIAGAANSAYNLSGAASTPAIFSVLGPVNIIGGSLTPSSSTFIGYENLNVINGTTYTTGILTVSGSSTVVTINGNILIIGRAGGTGTLVVSNGTVNVGNITASRNLAICYDGSAGASGTVNVYGGTLNVGSSSRTGNQIDFFQTGVVPTATALLTQSGGVINSWGGIIFGAASGTFSGGAATWTQTGGIHYVGQNGISRGAVYTTANNNNTISITLSGGIMGALANWSSAVPMTLGTANGNITFLCADNTTTPFNISLSGALTGAGGLNVSGGGTLTLSGANNYTGATVVSNGTLAIVTSPAGITNGPVTVDGSAGTPALAVTVSNPGQYWTNNGSMTFQNGTTALNFQFGALPPSVSAAPVQVSGNVAFNATPAVNVGGSAIAVGTYPLIRYTGAVSGAMPTSVAVWSGGTASAGYITNITASKTIALVVTASSYNPALSWRVGNGVWDINTTSNWTQFASPARYTDGNAVIFDDTASGTSPITVTLNTVVNPQSVTANNTAKNYVISGTGNIAGPAALTVLGGGTLTLAGTNSYSGGTMLNSGQLNLNNGGDPVNGTAIGTGPLTINSGATLDNTSGSDVTLQAGNPHIWNGDFTYVGSSNSLNTGSGQVTMNANTTVSVNSNTLTVGAFITDNGQNYKLSKSGNGTLMLPVGNNFGGGLTLSAGTLDLGDPGAAGSGVFTIFGGAIDNSSGADLTLTPPISYSWAGNFSFLGSANLDLGFATVSIPNGIAGGVTLNVVSNTLTTQGDILNNNTRVFKTGAGTWEITGFGSGAQSLGLIVSGGQVNLRKSSGQAIANGNNVGLTVQSNALVIDENGFQIHSHSPIPVPVTLSGGVWDLNGWNENVDQLFVSSGGTLRNGASASTSTLNLTPAYGVTLSGPNCRFDVPAADGNLIINGIISGNGSLVKSGAGVLNLSSNNTYAGDTTITGGTLILNSACLAAIGTVTATNALLELDFSGTNTIAGLVLNGASKSPGLYNATTDPAYLTGTGSLQVVSIPANPTNISVSVSGSTLSLSWPSNYVGWILQTNVLGLAAGAAWYDVPGSQTNTQITVQINNPAIANQLFRLRHP